MSIFSPSGNDVFRTQADQRFNSFSEPMNSVNQNGGGWGIDSNYLTPSYTSPFRPQYQGPNGNTYGRSMPGFGTSMNQVFNPFAGGGSNYGGNYWQQTSPYYDSLVNRPMDATASFAQNWALPAAATYGAYKFMGKGASAFGNAVGSGMTKGVMGGMFSNASTASRAMAMGGSLGGMAGGLIIPAVGASALVGAADKAVFDPYIAQRQMGRNLRDNFSGISFGEGTGDQFTGGGLSRRYAQQIAKNVSVAGAKDMTFNQTETSQIADFSSRAGLLDNTNSTQLTARFESIMKQVKLVMSVANTSDFKETIEIMSKMQMSGIGSGNLASAMGAMAGRAAAGGQSMQKIMNTVGSQGQYMFGAAGLTPYEGTMAAFSSSASHSAAYRSGLISPAMMARMGGIEGATQSSVAGTIANYSTPYAMMMAHNAYQGSGETGNVVSNMTKFGGAMAADPFRSVGGFMAASKALVSRNIGDNGLMGEQNQIYQIAKTMGNMGMNKDGRLDGGAAYSIMTGSMGMSHEQATAKLAEFGASQDKKTIASQMAGMDRASKEQLLKYQQQESLDKGIFTTPINAVKRGAYAVQAAGARTVGAGLEIAGGIADDTQAWMNEAIFGIKSGDNESLSFDKVNTANSNITLANFGSEKGKKYGMLREGMKTNAMHITEGAKNAHAIGKINEAALKGDTAAIKYLSSKGRDRADALDALMQKGIIGKEYANKNAAEGLGAVRDEMGDVTQKRGGVEGTAQSRMKDAMNSVLRGGTADQTVEYVTLMSKVAKTLDAGGTVDGGTREAIAKLMGGSAEDLNTTALREMSDKATIRIGKAGIGHLAGMGAVGSEEGLLEKLGKSGMDILMPKVDSAGDAKASRTQQDAQISIAKDKSRLRKLATEGKIDTSAYMAAVGALDNKETTGKFATAVDMFGQYVGRLNGDKSGNGGDTPSIWEYFAENKRAKTNGK